MTGPDRLSDPLALLAHFDEHGPIPLYRRVANLTRRHAHRTGHDPEATP